MQYEQKWGEGELEEIYASDPEETAEAMRWKEAGWDWEKVEG